MAQSAEQAVSHFTLVNGQPVDHVSVDDRGLAYGDGLFETVFLRPNHAPFLDLHLKRLQNSCTALAMPFPQAQISSSLQQAQTFVDAQYRTHNSAFVLKLLLTRGAGGNGYRPLLQSECTPTLVMTVRPFLRNEDRENTGVDLEQASIRLAHQPALAGHKHLNKLEYVLAAAHQQDPSAELLFLDQSNNVIESLHHNIFFVMGDTIVTPNLELCGVRGVLRHWLLEHAAKLSEKKIEQKKVTLEMAMQASEIFLSNAVRGIWPVKKIQNQTFAVGPVTRFLQTACHTTLWQSTERRT